MMLQAGVLLSKHDRRLSRGHGEPSGCVVAWRLDVITDSSRDCNYLVLAGAKLVEWGDPESGIIMLEACAGSRLPSRSARNSSHLVLRACHTAGLA